MQLGLTDIPTVQVDHLTPAQIRAYVIADNKLAENAGWDRELLALELKQLSVELDFDVTVTGFETAEIDILIGELSREALDKADIVPEVDRTMPAVSRLGDDWKIGNHRLFCGSALDRLGYQTLLGSKKAQMVFTDPPYNVSIAKHASGKGRIKHGEFPMASGEMSRGFLALGLGRFDLNEALKFTISVSYQIAVAPYEAKPLTQSHGNAWLFSFWIDLTDILYQGDREPATNSTAINRAFI